MSETYEYKTLEVQWHAVTFSRKQENEALETRLSTSPLTIREKTKYSLLAKFPSKEPAQAYLKERGWHRGNMDCFEEWKNGASDYDIEATILYHEEPDPKKWVGGQSAVDELTHALADLGGWKGQQWLHEHGYMDMPEPGEFKWPEPQA